MKYHTSFLIVFLLVCSTLSAAQFGSISGNIVFDPGLDGLNTVTISSNGDVGLGGISSGNKLHVAGNMKVTGLLNTNTIVYRSIYKDIQAVSTNTTISSGPIYLADASAGDITLTLPVASTLTGEEISVKKISLEGNVQLLGTGQLLDKTIPAIVLNGGNTGSIKFFSNGIDWLTLQERGTGTSDAFKMLVKTDNTDGTASASNVFIIPQVTGGTYSCNIDWGDGNSDTQTTDIDMSHGYAAAGNYLITITGTWPGLYFNNTGDKIKVLEVRNWGTSTWEAMSFRGCQNMEITALDGPITTGITSLSRAFMDCSSITNVPSMDTSNVTSFISTWENCTSLTSFPLINVSSSNILSGTWKGCTSLTSFPLLDISSITDIQNAWRDCTGLTSFPAIDTSQVTNLQRAWRNCTSLTTIPTLDFGNISNGIEAFFSVTLNITNYSNLLIDMESKNSSANITFHGGNSPFNTAGNVARQALIDRGWSITDGAYTP